MSTATESIRMEKGLRHSPWTQWARQISAIMRLEINKSLWGKRAILLYLIAALPILIMAALAVVATESTVTRSVVDAHGNVISHSTEVRSGPLQDAANANLVFAGLFEGLILRTVIFFGCAWIFMNLFRGEIIDRTLHYYFLAPVRREVLVLGKYFSGVVSSVSLFACSTAGALFFLYYARGFAASSRYVFQGPGLRFIFTYLGIAVLGCVGYGAFFLLVGLFFRNPIIPALLLYGWEWLNFLLPPVLKKISVIHYLTSLAPVPISSGSFAIVGEPTSAAVAILSLLLVTAAVLVFSCIRIRKMEIRYGSE